MRLWRRLTRRGRIVLGIGLLLAAAGVLLAQRDLFWLGAFGLILTLGALLMVSWPIRGLRHERLLAVSSVPVGTEIHVKLRLQTSGRGPARLLHFEDVVPPSMGIRPRFALSGRLSAVGENVGYRLVGQQRGRFRLGPLLVRSLDPFGLAHNDMAFATTTEIAITPRVHPLARLQSGAAGASAETHSARAGLVGQDDVLVREYRRGDDVRRVHWRSTARTGQLMVRREEQSWQPTTRLLIDNRRSAHAGLGNHGSFEWAVSAAASAGLSLLASGSTLELAAADGLRLGPDADRAVRSAQLLDELTDIHLTRADELDAGLAAAGDEQRPGSSLLAILGRVSESDIALLLDQPGGGSRHAILLEVDSFAGDPVHPGQPVGSGQPARSAQSQPRTKSGFADEMSSANAQIVRGSNQQAMAARLVERGWSVVVANAETSIPDAWESLRSATAGLT